MSKVNHEQKARKVLESYPVAEPVIEFIRHNENLTYSITDRGSGRTYLLRIHEPVTKGLFGIQHTLEGLQSEVLLLQELGHNHVLQVQMPVRNSFGEYVTEVPPEENGSPCYATLLEWIDGNTFTQEEAQLDEIVYNIGVNLARLHNFARSSATLKNLHRPVYGMERIDTALEELRYGVEAGLYRLEHYEIMSEVLSRVKGLMRELDSKEGTWGLIHADFQKGNIIINERGEPCFIDFCLSGYGHYLFDIGSASWLFESKQRDKFLEGYSSETSFHTESLRCVEGLMLMDVFVSYVFFIRDSQRNGWIKNDMVQKIELCKEWLAGKDIYDSLV